MKIGAPPKRPRTDWQLQLINIVFLLLLFFVMNGTIVNIQDPTIELPKSVELGEGGTVSEAAYIDAANRMSFDGRPATAGIIAKAWLESARPDRKAMPLLVLADRRLSAAQLLVRLQELRAAGLFNLSIVTLREPQDAK